MAKRGNPGYGKMENIRQNVDKFSPVFWQLMEEFAQSKSKDDKRFFITEFNKIQTKMVPTEVGGIDGEPIHIQLSGAFNCASGDTQLHWLSSYRQRRGI
jgi:hypothetical protein